MKRVLTSAVSTLCLATSLFSQSVSVGQTAPDFSLDKFGGGTLSLSDYPETIIFLYFFGAT